MTEERTFRVAGMSCGGCARGLTAAFQRAGITATIDHATGTATVSGPVTLAEVRAAVEGAGFQFGGPLAGGLVPGGEVYPGF